MKISKNQDGLLGVVNEAGKTIIPFIYDEITLFGDKYYCRIWKDSYWYSLAGVCIGHSTHRKDWLDERGPDVINTNRVNHNCTPRQDLDNVPLEAANGVFYKYRNGKFGVLNHDGAVILPCEYDDVWRWPSCDVIQTRIGTTHSYYDLSGNQILKKHHLGPVYEWLAPYTLSEQQNDIALMTMEFVDSCRDDQCCMCYGRPTRLDRVLRQNIEGMMRASCEHKKYPADAFVRFNGFDNYIYRAYIAHGKGTNPMGDCIRQLHQMKCYASSWFYLDKVLTNKNTKLCEEELALLHFAANDCESGGNTEIGYGIDNNLEDGEVKVIHIEYFADHWPDPEEFNQEPTFGLLENCLDPINDEWEETKQVLESRRELSSYGLISQLAWDMTTASEDKEISFVVNAIKWGLEHGWNPNEPFLGKTALEHTIEIIDWCGKSPKSRQNKIDTLLDIKKLLEESGGMTLKNCRKQNLYYQEEDFV